MARKTFTVDHPNYILETLAEIAQEKGYEFESQPDYKEGNFNDWNAMYCRLHTPQTHVDFQLQQMPGCCAVLVLSYVKPRPYSQENFDAIVSLVEEAAKDAGFGSVAMTQCVPAFSKMLWDKEPWIKTLDRGWIASEAFINAKSGNKVVYLTKDLKQNHKIKGLEVRVQD